MGLAATRVSLGPAFILAHLMPVSNLLGNVVTMIGLAVGIDYSLLMVKDFRERLHEGPTRSSAVAETVAEAGTTICGRVDRRDRLARSALQPDPGDPQRRHRRRFGGVGLRARRPDPVAGMPGAARQLGRALARSASAHPLKGADGKMQWRRLAAWIVRRPVCSLALAGGAVCMLAFPSSAPQRLQNEPGSCRRALESRVGADILCHIQAATMRSTCVSSVRTTDGKARADAGSRCRRSTSTSRRPHARPTVAAVVSPLSTARRRPRPIYLSQDGHAALFDLTPAEGLSMPQIQPFARDLARLAPVGPFSVMIGGAPAYYNEFSEYMWKSFPKVFGFVILDDPGPAVRRFSLLHLAAQGCDCKSARDSRRAMASSSRFSNSAGCTSWSVSKGRSSRYRWKCR